MAKDNIADFVAGLLVREGCWVVEPSQHHNDSYIRELLSRLRHIPVRIRNPPGSSTYKFAERGSEGHWFFVWIPGDK